MAAALPADQPSIVVIDELPWLLESDQALEGALQTAWDRALSRKPVLLILIGSDLAMMERLDDYTRPFHQRATVMVLPALNPVEVGGPLGCAPADALDAYLVTGGYLWSARSGTRQDVDKFLRGSAPQSDISAACLGRAVARGKFPAEIQAREVLSPSGTASAHGRGSRVS